ncbi:hypothetical protein PybrP1_000650 [[Pythium] brassicae (nom. inval.)]|nr:hypothetical protein PybrP1_000650 [[Pythium] brassicae (nom. inval.)]
MAPRERNVRVYTVACESRHVLVRNVPALGVIDELLDRLRLYGEIGEYRVVDPADVAFDDDAATDADTARELEKRFTQVVYVKYATVNNARHAKVRATQKPFFGSVLQVTYAPQFETREDTLEKLTQRRELLRRRARGAGAGGDRRSLQPPLPPPPQSQQPRVQQRAAVPATASPEFIGPQLPPRDWRQAPAPLSPPPPLAAPLKRPVGQTHPPNPEPKRRRI